MKFLVVALIASSSGGLIGEIAGLPPWLVQLIVQFPLVALFYWRESRERKRAIDAEQRLVEYLDKAPDKLIAFSDAQRNAMTQLETKCEAVIEIASRGN